MIRTELCSLIGGKINMTDSATLVKLGAWAERRHTLICDMELWKDLLSIYTFAVSAAQSELILPHQVDRYVAARYDHQNLMPVDQVFLFATDPQIWDRTGLPTRVAELPAMGTYVKPSSERVQFVSTNSGDTTQKISLVGELAGVEMRETLTLNGTTPVVSTNSYDLLYNVSKQQTSGNVSATGFTSLAALLTLFSDETHRRHIRLRLLETPANAITVMVLGKRKPTPYRQDSDAPAVRGISAVLECFVHGDALDWLEQKDDAKGKWAEANAQMAVIKETEVFQAANIQQLVPYDGHGSGELMGKGFW